MRRAGAVLILTEYGPFAITLSFLTLALLIFIGIAIFGRPGIAAALSLALIAVLIALSQFKHGILELTLTFLDFLIIDSATFSFMNSVFPSLRWQLALAALLSVPVLWLIWRFDPFRIPRLTALAGAAASLAAIVALSVAVPEQPWEPFQGVNHISNLARSGVASASQLASGGWLEAAAKSPAKRRCRRRARAARRARAGRISSCCWMSRASIFAPLPASRCRQATAISSSRSTAGSGRSSPRQPAVRPGTPNSTS